MNYQIRGNGGRESGNSSGETNRLIGVAVRLTISVAVDINIINKIRNVVVESQNALLSLVTWLHALQSCCSSSFY